MDIKKTARILVKTAPVIAAAAGVFSLALSKYEESQGDFSREFPDAEDKIKEIINEVKMTNGN